MSINIYMIRCDWRYVYKKIYKDNIYNNNIREGEYTRTNAIARSLEKKKDGKILLIQFNRIQVYNV
jgi:hypothetical protein